MSTEVDFSRVEARVLAYYIASDDQLYELWWHALSYGASARKRMELIDFARAYGGGPSPRRARTPLTSHPSE